MKKMTLLLASVLLSASATVSLAEDSSGLDSLRKQGLEIQDPAAKLKNYPKDNEKVGLSYIQQPPLVPHSVRGYQIDRNVNKCLSCHSFKNYKKYDATKISTSHFTNRDGTVLSDVSPRRYFCMQCHVPQVKAQPLVENNFKPSGALSD